jgi:hypothetical protein
MMKPSKLILFYTHNSSVPGCQLDLIPKSLVFPNPDNPRRYLAESTPYSQCRMGFSEPQANALGTCPISAALNRELRRM